MDIKDYIQSGAVESYVLGLSGKEEIAEIESLIVEHTDVKQAITEFETMLEKYHLQNNLTPPESIKKNIFSLIDSEIKINQPQSSSDVSMPFIKNVKAQPLKLWQYATAAAILLFVVSAALNIYFYNNYHAANNKYQALLSQQNNLQASNESFQTKFDSLFKQQDNLLTTNNAYKTKINSLSESLKVMTNPAMQVIKMKGVPGKENNQATVYWNAATKDVYLLQNTLPETPLDKQYQLWAIVNGKPVDAGLISNCEGLCKMKNIPKAQAFAITLEKKGGSASPTMSAMFVMGTV